MTNELFNIVLVLKEKQQFDIFLGDVLFQFFFWFVFRASPLSDRWRYCEYLTQRRTRSGVTVETTTENMVEDGDIRVVHRGGSKINYREPVLNNDSR